MNPFTILGFMDLDGIGVSTDRSESAARLLLDQGLVCIDQQLYDKAVTYFVEAASIASQEGNKLLEARAFGNVATTCAKQGEHETALDMYRCVLPFPLHYTALH
jgi:tetratricopeptide (TPR) repeat protein